jgi:DNA-directed RNA polymerase sigma subunit (sigma70/sigma32)
LSLGEIGSIFGLTRERIRQIERQGLAKLRRKLRLRGLDLDDLIAAAPFGERPAGFL